MLTARELSAALFGAWRLVKLDADGFRYFDASLTGFWQSFHAAALVAPIYALLLLFDGFGDGFPRVLLIEAIAYVMRWVAYPLAIVHLTRLFGRERQFFRYMVAYNWFQLPQTLILLPVALISGFGLLPDPAAIVLGLAVLLVSLGYAWFLATRGLQVDGFTAAGLVVIDLLLTVFISSTAEALTLRPPS